jgi:hypothetical protein
MHLLLVAAFICLQSEYTDMHLRQVSNSNVCTGSDDVIMDIAARMVKGICLDTGKGCVSCSVNSRDDFNSLKSEDMPLSLTPYCVDQCSSDCTISPTDLVTAVDVLLMPTSFTDSVELK